MNKKIISCFYPCVFTLLFSFFLSIPPLHGQENLNESRLTALEKKLDSLTIQVPGLNERVSLTINGAPIQEVLTTISDMTGINIYIESAIQAEVYCNFSLESVKSILLHLAREYQLDIFFSGNILSFKKIDLNSIKSPKTLQIEYFPAEKLISLFLENDSLVHVARKITQESGYNVIVSQELKESLVSLFVQKMDFAKALLQIAFNNKIKVVETSDGAYIFLPLGEREQHFINNEAELAIRHWHTDSIYFDTNFRYEDGMILLADVEAHNTPIEEIIKNAAIQTNTSYFLLNQLKGNVSFRAKQLTFSELLSKLFINTPYDFRKESDVFLIGERNVEGLRKIELVPLQYRSLDTIKSMLPNDWLENVEIKEFKEQNTLLIAGSASQVDEITRIIKKLDRLIPMVLVEVTMLDVRKGYHIKTGISAGTSDSIKTGGIILPGLDYRLGAGTVNDLLSKIGVGTFNLGKLAPDFYVQLSALEDNNNVEMRSVPKLSTLNGHTASLKIGNTRYYRMSTQNVIGSLNPQTVVTQQYNEVSADMTIQIRPVVSGDEQVTLDLKIDISDFTQDTAIEEPPPTTNSSFESIIRVRNGETVVLGGIERFESSNKGSGLPVLSRIPVLNWIFSAKSKSKNKIVSIVFVKPTIIYR